MVGFSHGKFRIVLLTPRAKLLDAKVGSVIVPAHDGQLGVLRNHCPTLAKLGYGILQVHEIADHPDAYYLIEGGFVRIGENHMTVLAYDVTTFEGKSPEEIEKMVSHARSVVADQDHAPTQQGTIEARKAKFIMRMAELADIESPRVTE